MVFVIYFLCLLVAAGIIVRLVPARYLPVFFGAVFGFYALAGKSLFLNLHDNALLAPYALLIELINKASRQSAFTAGYGCGPVPWSEYYQRTLIFLFHLTAAVFLLRGLIFACKKKERVLVLLTVLAGLLAAFSVFDLYLGTKPPRNLYIAHQDEEINRKINAGNLALSNRRGFTDRERPYQKERPGVFRIAVLGDSFVWGDGTPWKDIWPHVLQEKLAARYGDKIEVLSWARNGWSTENELRFMASEGRKFEIDLLIVGITTNDPVVFNECLPRKFFSYDALARDIPFFKNTFRFLAYRINDLLYKLPWFGDWGYAGWENSLYAGKNWEAYGGIVRSMASFLEKEKIPCLFVVLPGVTDVTPVNQDKYRLISDLFRQNNLPLLDLYPPFRDRFRPSSSVADRKRLWANPANAHPGRPVTEFYSESVIAYLEKNRLLPD